MIARVRSVNADGVSLLQDETLDMIDAQVRDDVLACAALAKRFLHAVAEDTFQGDGTDNAEQ